MKKDLLTKLRKYITFPNVLLCVIVILMVLILGRIVPLGGMSGSTSSVGSIMATVTGGTSSIIRPGGTVINGGPLHLDRIHIQTDVAGQGIVLYNASNSTNSIYEFFSLHSDTIGGNLEGEYVFDVDLNGLNANVSSGVRTLFIYNPK